MSLRSFFLRPIDDLAEGIGVHIAAAPRRSKTIALVAVAAVATWWVYVPIHELLHVAGCVITGGSVTELQIKPIYGGAWLARVFPFVRSGGDYAGRLTGFDTGGSDLVYLATDFAPFVLSVLVGVPLLKASLRRHAPTLFGVSIVLGVAPILNITGDYYEMGSIIVTRVFMMLTGEGWTPVAVAVRSDDVFRLVGDLWTASKESGFHTLSRMVTAYVLAVISFGVGIVLALGTYAIGDALSGVIVRRGRGTAAGA